MSFSSPVRADIDPQEWRHHRWGLSEARWRALAGRGIWITGAGTGFGRVMAIAAAAAGAAVFLTGRRRSHLVQTVAEIAALEIAPDHCRPLVADVTDPRQVAAAAAEIEACGARLYGVVHCAALPEPPGAWPLTELPAQTVARVFDTNVIGSWLVSKAALPLMAQGGSGRILFMSSEAGWASTPGFGPYNISKAALNSLGASFAAEAAARHRAVDIQVNVLDPGEARTEMNQGSSIGAHAVLPMALALLSHPAGGPNGHFFHRDGRHLTFAYSPAYDRLVTDDGSRHDRTMAVRPQRRGLLSYLSRVRLLGHLRGKPRT